jgi:hypothetical protein
MELLVDPRTPISSTLHSTATVTCFTSFEEYTRNSVNNVFHVSDELHATRNIFRNKPPPGSYDYPKPTLNNKSMMKSESKGNK